MKVSIYLLLLMFTATVASAQSPSKLALNAGTVLKLDNTVKTEVSQEMMGQTIDMSFDATSNQKIEVKEKKRKSYLLTSTITEVKFTGSAMGRDMNFDSNKQEDLDGDMGKGVKMMLNKPKDVELGEDSKVIDHPEAKAKADDTQADPFAQMMNSFGAGPDNSYGTKAAFTVVPTGLRPGESWTDSTITEDVKTYTTYTLKSSNGTESAFTLTGTQRVSKKMTQMEMEVVVNLTGKMTGEGTVDNRTGIIKKSTIMLESTGTSEVMGQSIPITSKVTSSVVVTVL